MSQITQKNIYKCDDEGLFLVNKKNNIHVGITNAVCIRTPKRKEN